MSGNPTRVAVIYGTRPEAIKMAPVIRALRADPDFDVVVVATGQHGDLVAPIEALFTLTPDVDLRIMSRSAGLNETFARIVGDVGSALERMRPEVVLVHGDTSTAAASSLAAFHLGITIGHVEAGLRTGDLRQPFPEEANRRLIGTLAAIHFAPTDRSVRNLLDGQVAPENIIRTGNTVIDALNWALELAEENEERDLVERDPERRLLVVTLHRRENHGKVIDDLSAALARVAQQRPDLDVVFPMHPNPLVRAGIRAHLEGIANVRLIEPIGYAGMAVLLSRAWLLVTDSGGLQEEAPTFGVPILVARNTTERPEVVDAGVAELIGDSGESLEQRVLELLDDQEEWARMARPANPFGDGRAALRIRDALRVLCGHEMASTKAADLEVIPR